MKQKKALVNSGLCLLLAVLVGIFLLPVTSSADWMKMDPPPDVDKAAHGHVGTGTCWLATASNMLAGAGYGIGTTVQTRADNIYGQLVAHFGTGGGWTDTALTWWLGSAHNIWPSNPYDVVTVYGNKTRTPWANSNGARYIGNELRRCEFLGLSISWPRTSAGGSAYGGHAIACWGDSGGSGTLAANPSQVIVVDSDRDTGGDVQTYTYDLYTNPNPSGYDEGNGWYVNYSSNHPFIKHIITLCPTDDPGDHVLTQKVIGSYRIHQGSREREATDLHYNVGTDVEILSYKTTIDWPTNNKPTIVEVSDRELRVDWDLTDNPVPYCTWVTITTEFVLPYWNAINYTNVYFTPLVLRPFPYFRWELITPVLPWPDPELQIPDISGGYVIGAFDLIDPQLPPGENVVAEYRLLHEYSYFQDPEHHEFYLQTLEPMGYRVGNVRFGHVWTEPMGEEELWEFDEWMTRDGRVIPLEQFPPMVLDWQNRLPYPEREIYHGQEEPLECTEYLPQDFNRDCFVNFKDFARFAEAWLHDTLL